MQKPSKEMIVRAYNSLVKERGGKLIGEGVFKRETEISPYYWRGGYWPSWSAFQADAGYVPNSPTQKIPDEILLHCFAELALEKNKIPTQGDLRLKRNDDPSFPDHAAFSRWGGRDQLLGKVAEYCEKKKNSHQSSPFSIRVFPIALIRELILKELRDSFISFALVRITR